MGRVRDVVDIMASMPEGSIGKKLAEETSSIDWMRGFVQASAERADREREYAAVAPQFEEFGFRRIRGESTYRRRTTDGIVIWGEYHPTNTPIPPSVQLIARMPDDVPTICTQERTLQEAYSKMAKILEDMGYEI